MRRVIPYVLLAVLTLGAGAGIALGVANHSSPAGPTPARWVAALLETTADAGTAHFAYASVTASSNPNARQTLRGSGEVDFAADRAKVDEVSHSIDFGGTGTQLTAHPTVDSLRQIEIGRVTYQQFGPPGTWLKLDDPGTRSGPMAPLTGALNAQVALEGLTGNDPVTGLRDLGPAVLDGLDTTEYLVSTAPPPVCASARRDPTVVRQLPSTVWVDGQGRLVQVRSAIYDNGKLLPSKLTLPGESAAQAAALRSLVSGATTTTSTLRFSDFGAPVAISAPSAVDLEPSGSGFAIALRPCH